MDIEVTDNFFVILRYFNLLSEVDFLDTFFSHLATEFRFQKSDQQVSLSRSRSRAENLR
jgi:hypothetical protein